MIGGCVGLKPCPCVGSYKQNYSESEAHSEDQKNIKRYIFEFLTNFLFYLSTILIYLVKNIYSILIYNMQGITVKSIHTTLQACIFIADVKGLDRFEFK